MFGIFSNQKQQAPTNCSNFDVYILYIYMFSANFSYQKQQGQTNFKNS
jgi:hypothetical protein